MFRVIRITIRDNSVRFVKKINGKISVLFEDRENFKALPKRMKRRMMLAAYRELTKKKQP